MKKKWQDDWRESGLAEGDVVLVHSSISGSIRKAKEDGVTDITPGDLLESFIDAVGPTGTLLLPLFNFGFSSGRPFDMRSTPSEMGALSEAARLRPGTVRTGHPIYSFGVIGHLAEKFSGLENFSGYGEDSPFGLLRELDGKIALLNLDAYECMTFYHHVEEVEKAENRYFKDFTGPYTNLSGETTERTFQLFVRNVEKGVVTNVKKMGDITWDLGLYTGHRGKSGTGLSVIRARALYEATATVIREGRNLDVLYSIHKD